MRIGIDVSQTAYQGTGVSKYLSSLVQTLLKLDSENEYVLFFASLRKKIPTKIYNLSSEKVKIKKFKLPPTALDILWNKLHILPIEQLVGDVDIFVTSDWTEPPTKRAKKATILYDLLVYKYSNEMDKKIVQTQKRKLKWVKKESAVVFCISESTKKDAQELLGIDKNRLKVLYPGA